MSDERDLSASIGAAVRVGRQRLGLSTRALAAQAGVSQSLLSTIENGRSLPSVSTLYDVATALGVVPADLLPASADADGGGHSRLLPASSAEGHGATSLLHSAPGSALEVYRIVLPAQYRDPVPFRHRGEDHMHVLEGALTVWLDDVPEHLTAGDSLWFDAPRKHRMVTGASGAVVVLTTAR